MADYCGECALWQGSSDVNRYGERWCPHSRRYEKADQNTYGCKGFVDASRRYCSPLTVEEQLLLSQMKNEMTNDVEVK